MSSTSLQPGMCGFPERLRDVRRALFRHGFGKPANWLCLCVWCVVSCFVPSRAQSEEPAVDYLREIKPLFRDKCYVCHGVLRQEAGLRVDTAALLRSGSDSGSVIDPNDPDNSLLMRRLTSADPSERMPQEAAPLTREQLDKVRRWIAAGAPGPENEAPQSDPREHWAFRVPKRPPIPDVSHREWVANPIDAFVVANYEKLGLVPQPMAEPPELLRRVYLDLVGLPPTEAQLQEFLEDSSQEAWSRIVDRLLSSPQYGERWGRHWMDVWRYSDWYGRRMVPDVWNSAPQIWRWRDWIVRSLNQDKGYDRMILEMLAGDELAPDDPDVTVATGYLVRNWYALNPNDWMRANVEHTAKAFLGLTFNCAHCHDHKYDPITQLDYFRLRAFFEPLGVRQDRVAGEPDPGVFEEYQYSKVRRVQRLGMVRAFDQRVDAPTWFYTGGDERNRQTDRGSVSPGIPAFFGERLTIEPIDLPPAGWYPALQPRLKETLLQEAAARVDAARSVLEKVQGESANWQQQWDEAHQELQQKLQPWKQAPPHPWFGQPVLLVNAKQGRRLLLKWLPVDFPATGRTAIEFDLALLCDNHVNFQLLKDVKQSLTALYLGFQEGQILAYQPGSFTEIPIGNYSRQPPILLHVSLQIDTQRDVAVVSIHSDSQSEPLVNAVPVALNGWSPARSPHQPMAFDARAGSVAAVKDLRIEVADDSGSDTSERIASHWVDFSRLPYVAQLDVAGLDGWEEGTGSHAEGKSYITWCLGGPVEAEVFERQWAVTAWRAAHAASRLMRAEAEWEAAVAEQQSVECRVAADERRYLRPEQGDVEFFVRRAVEAERSAKHAEAIARQAMAWNDWLGLLVQETTAADHQKKLSAARQQLIQTASRLQAITGESRGAELPADYTPLSPQYPTRSSGRRAALAGWIASPSNPLTARVAVNHIWMRHFGQPLVDTVFDFGTNGAKPLFPELLDWLACEFVESGYSMKHLHRLITTSRTYRLSSSPQGATVSPRLDPDNRYLWRAHTGRMEAEVVRDAVLAACGMLDFTMGGQELENSEALTTRRRSLYYSCHPEVGGKSPIGEWFDGPDPNECYRRSRTVVPQQALILTNSEWIHQMSSRLAERLWAECRTAENPEEQFLRRAFRSILTREPTAEELAVCRAWLNREAPNGQPDGDRLAAMRRAAVVRVLFNHNDFVAIR
ncbi:MAG: hypothetical protein KatS3mg110_0159 [Pirellulaceae bacterium]|nr:MAG: hypothetical protein KatS3mg110_0159 [Pirellulaceae bacterium]